MRGSGTLALAGITTAAVVAAAVLVGDGATDDGFAHVPEVQAAGVGLVAFDACDSMVAELSARALAAGDPWRLGGMQFFAAEDTVAAVGGDSAAEPSAPARDASDTNVQVAGVDEPDLTETDGRRLFTTSNGFLRVIDVSTPVPAVLASVALPEGGDPQLLLDGDRLLVLWTSWGVTPMRDTLASSTTDMVAPGQALTRLALYDVAADTPALVGSFEVEGTLVTARGIDGVVHAIVAHRPAPFGPVVLEDVVAATTGDELQARLRDALRGTNATDWLPAMATTDATGVVTAQPAVDCTQVRATSSGDDTSLLTVLTFDVHGAGLAPVGSAAVLTDATTVTANARQLVVATPVFTPVAGDRPAPEEVAPDATDVAEGQPVEQEPVDPEGEDEPEPELVEPLPVEPGFAPEVVRWDTRVHLFDLAATGATYLASGEVPGTVLNQFSMDLYEDTLRVATTVGEPWAGGSESQVAVLRRSGDRLEQVGVVGGLGLGERIYSVRFMGDRAYVVTFRQVDPLYTLDLTDPANPRAVGELKITGYSAYLHPLGEHRLLGIGQEATEEGRTVGTQVSLFDVSDAANPRRLSQVVLPNAYSDAEWDHHAVLVHAGLAALPFQRWDLEPTADNPEGFEVGALVLDASPDGVALRGTVTPNVGDAGKGDPWNAQVRRIVYVDGTLYLVGWTHVTAVDAATLATTGTVTF